jgi:hypothetical protein
MLTFDHHYILNLYQTINILLSLALMALKHSLDGLPVTVARLGWYARKEMDFGVVFSIMSRFGGFGMKKMKRIRVRSCIMTVSSGDIRGG